MMDPDEASQLLSVALSSSGLEGVLQKLTDRIDELELRSKASEHRKEKKPDVDMPKAHLCETSGIQDLSKRAPEQQMAAMAEAVVNMGHNINQFYKDVKYREAVQQVTDTAQDEIMHMELARLHRQLEIKFTRNDAANMRKMIAVEMRSMREEIQQDFEGRLTIINHEVSEHLEKVMEQVRLIQESTQTTNDLLKDRIADAFEDIQSSSEDMDVKIRKINDIFGIGGDSDGRPQFSLEDMISTLEELREHADAVRTDVDTQEATIAELADKVDEIQGSTEDKMETLEGAFKGEFGEGMAKTLADLDNNVRALESKVDGGVAKHLEDFSRRLDDIFELINGKGGPTAAVEGVQDKLVEQARAQEEMLQLTTQELRASLEKGVEHQLARVNNEMSSLGGRMAEAEESVATSADKVNAVGYTVKSLGTKHAELQSKTTGTIAALNQKLTDALRDMGQTTAGLQEEVGGLAVVVRNNHNELHSHVKSSKAFIQMVRDQQDVWGSTCKALGVEVESYKLENGDRMTSLERSNVSVVITMRGLQRAVDALATKEARWDRLDVQSKKHVQVLGRHLAELEGEATFTEPFSLSPAMQKHLSAVSQIVAKIIATRADYEVTRQAINRKNPAEDSDWDNKVDALRRRHLEAFVGGVVQVASRLRPLPSRPVEEVRETFARKLDLGMKLAISKYKPIQAGATILGKVHLLPSCMACDRPFTDNPGPGDQRSVVQDSRGSGRSRGNSPAGRGNRSPGGGAFSATGQRAHRGGEVVGGMGGSAGSPTEACASSSFAEDDGSVTSITSLASKESQVSSSTASRSRARANRDHSTHKYILRAGFKMRQSSSEGAGIGINLRRGVNLGDSMRSTEYSTGEGFRDGDGGFEGGGRGTSVEGRARDQINGAPLELRPSTVSAQVGVRRDRGTRITFRDHDGIRSWGDGGGGRGGYGGVVGDEDVEEHSPLEDVSSNVVAVHLPSLP